MEKEFRAWNPIKQEWEYYTFNDLCYNTNRPDICLERWSQWTGLFDCKENKIYENDIVKCTSKGFNIGEEMIKVVKWDNGESGESAYKKAEFFPLSCIWFNHRNCEIIGNRFQNPELIKE